MFVVGHKKQREKLAKLVARAKLPHSLLFAGPSGVGKKVVAHELVAALLCEKKTKGAENACGECGSCSMIEAGTHPDLHLLSGLDKKQASVEAIRELLQSIQLKPFRGAARAVILDDAEYLSVQALNVLLKTLEEPRADTFFILIAQNPGRLPATVLSRCQRWYYDSLTEGEILQILTTRSEHSPANLKLADGSVSNLLALDSSENFEDLRSALSRICSGDRAAAIRLAKELSADRESLRQKLDYLRIIARDEMLNAETEKLRFVFANLLHNLVFARELIFERNINANYLLAAILTSLASTEDREALRFQDILGYVVG